MGHFSLHAFLCVLVSVTDSNRLHEPLPGLSLGLPHSCEASGWVGTANRECQLAAVPAEALTHTTLGALDKSSKPASVFPDIKWI